MIDIIIPTYNEKQNLCPLFLLIQTTLKDPKIPFHIILIDDNSPDGTYTEAKRLKKKINMTLIKRKGKLGLGSAYKEAIEHCKYDFVVILDADLSHNPCDIRKLISKMEIQESGESKYDIVISSRYLKDKDSGVVGWNFKRKLTSRGANTLAQILLNLEYSDLTGSYRLYRRDVFEDLMSKVKSNGYAYQMEIIYVASKHELRIAEVPIVFHERRAGVSKLSFWEILKYLFALTRLFLLY